MGKTDSAVLVRQTIQGWRKVLCVLCDKSTIKTYKTFLAAYRPARSVIRVVIVKENHGLRFFFRAEPHASPRAMIAAFADRPVIKHNSHDMKELRGIGKQHVRNNWANIACHGGTEQ